ncbi:MAG: hypothetical protein IPM39_19430 [Chloroflexi bacterium]|nr:hypothetical protein [Chloroflexota bacterium]
MRHQIINNSLRFFLLASLFLLTSVITNSTQAQERLVVFQEEGELLLQGTPGSSVVAPVTIISGETAVTNITFTLDVLINRDQSNEAISGTVATFTPNNFNIAPHTTRTVLLSIPVVPDKTGTYRGELRVQSDEGEMLSRVVTLNIAYAGLEITPSTAQIMISGSVSNLQHAIWLASPFGDAKEIKLVAGQLRNTSNQEVIQPTQVSLKEASVDLRRGDRRLVTISITGENILPGTYTGQIYFVQKNQLVDEALKLDLTVTVFGAPSVTLPQGGTVIAHLIRPKGGPNEFFARWLMPADYRQDGLTLQIQNDGLDAVRLTSVQTAIMRYGSVNATGVPDILNVTTPTMTVPAGETAVVRLQTPQMDVLPGAYKGAITMLLTDVSGSQRSQIKQMVQVDLSVRNGPALALFLILLGIIFGRIVNVANSDQVRLLGEYYRLENQVRKVKANIPEEYYPDLERIREDGKMIRDAIYTGKSDMLAERLKNWEKKPDKLRLYIANYPLLEKTFQEDNLSDEDVQILERYAKDIRQRIHDDETLNVKTDLSRLIKVAAPLRRLRQLEEEITAANFAKKEIDFFMQHLGTARLALLNGEENTANNIHNNLAKALNIFPDIVRIEKEAKEVFSGKPRELLKLERELNIAHREVTQFQFEQALQRLFDIREKLVEELEPQNDIQPMGDFDVLEENDRASIRLSLDGVAERLALMRTAPTPVFVDEQILLEQPSELKEETRWRRFVARIKLRLLGLVTNFRPELGLRLGRPLVWIITVTLLVLTGFQTLYVAQGITFGANPMTDYLVLFLWGVTSDVSGATVSSLADKWLTKKN